MAFFVTDDTAASKSLGDYQKCPDEILKSLAIEIFGPYLTKIQDEKGKEDDLCLILVFKGPIESFKNFLETEEYPKFAPIIIRPLTLSTCLIYGYKE